MNNKSDKLSWNYCSRYRTGTGISDAVYLYSPSRLLNNMNLALSFCWILGQQNKQQQTWM